MFFEVPLSITVFPALFVLYIFWDVLIVHSDVHAVPFDLCLLSSRSYFFKCPFCAPCKPFYTMSSMFPLPYALMPLEFTQFLPYFVFSQVLLVQYLMFSMHFMSSMCQCPLCPRGTPVSSRYRPPGVLYVLEVPRVLQVSSSRCPLCPRGNPSSSRCSRCPISAYHLIPF
jgi:hypothetical protein